MRINIAKIKGLGKDEYGNDRLIYLTEKQVEILGEMRNDPERRYCFVKVGRFMFSPMDVIIIEEKEVETYELPNYALERLQKEHNQQLEEGKKNLHA